MELDRLEGWWGEKGGEVIYTKTGYKPDNFTIRSPSLGNKLAGCVMCISNLSTIYIFINIERIKKDLLRFRWVVGGMPADTISWAKKAIRG